jgi:hypothetical protein
LKIQRAKKAIAMLTVTLITGACATTAAEPDTDIAETTPASQGPLTDFLNSLGGGAELSQEEQARRFDERNRRQQELIAQCMTDAGFEYIPNLGAATISFSDPNLWRPDDRDWVAQWGYGTVNDPWRHAESAETVPEEPLYTDPNADLLAEMSEAEATAWQQALWGAPAQDDPDGDLVDTGCWAWASAETDDDAALHTVVMSDEFAPLIEALQLFSEYQWTETTEADRDWVNCMADAGHTGFERRYDARNSIQAEQNEFWNNFDWEAWDDGVGGMPNPSDFPELVALGEREIELALVDLDCRVAVDLQARNQAHQIAAETRFFSDHHAELEALRDAIEQGK